MIEVARSRPATDSPLVLRVLGVAAAAFLGVGTFASLGLAIAQTLYDRGVFGDAGPGGMDALGFLAAGVIVGAVVGVATAVWVGVHVWQSRWALLLVLVGVAVVTLVTLVITTAG